MAWPVFPALLLALTPDARAELPRYQSCDELQAAVREALLGKKRNDDAQEAKFRRDEVRSAEGALDKALDGVPMGAAPPTVRTGAENAGPKSAAAAGPGGSKEAAVKPEKDEQFTNIQEIGVAEPDHVKISGSQVFVLRGKDIQVADRKTLKPHGSISLMGMTRGRKLLVSKSHLFVLGELEEAKCNAVSALPVRAFETVLNLLVPPAHAEPGFVDTPFRPERPACVPMVYTVVQAYKLGEGKPGLVRGWQFKGRYVDARLTAGQIALVFNQSLNLVPELRVIFDNPDAVIGQVPEKPITIDDHNKSSLMSCSTIFRSDLSDLDFRLTKVVAIDSFQLDREPRQAGFIGGGDQIYMSTDNLYLSKIGKRWLPWGGNVDATARLRDKRDSLVITKVGFEKDITILAQSSSELKGRPKDQWAFKELSHRGEKLLGVFTTTGDPWSKDPLDSTNNFLWVLKRSGPKLSIVAKLPDIAKGENIRSIRYVGEWAYAVTFKKTDPLFAIDLSDPLKPRIVGQLKIPGFSTYMHPVGKGRMIGIGFDVFLDSQGGEESVKAQGIKLSLFDVSNPKELKELDMVIIGDRGSYSDVTGNHHAFFYDEKLQRLAFPVTTLQGGSKTEKWSTSKKITFAGAVLFEIGKRRFKQLTRWRHNRWIPVSCYEEMMKGRFWEEKAASLDINRIYRVDNDYLTASRFGLKSYGVEKPGRVHHELRFEGDYKDCRTLAAFE